MQFLKSNFELDRKLYKYYSNMKYAIDAIQNKRVYLGRPDNFNDPFDDAIFNDGVGMDGKEGIYLDGMIHLGRIACFSEVPDSILMWSYYADCHRGFCLEFDISLLEDNELNRTIIKSFSKVHYSPVRPVADLSFDASTNYIFSKADVWSHEQEWRIYSVDEVENYLPFNCISRVILGANYYKKYSDNSDLIIAAKDNNLDIYKYVLSRQYYKLDIVKA